MNQWVDDGVLSIEAVESLLEANNGLNTVMGFPTRIDPAKRQIADPLKRYLQLTSSAVEIQKPQHFAVESDPKVDQKKNLARAHAHGRKNA